MMLISFKNLITVGSSNELSSGCNIIPCSDKASKFVLLLINLRKIKLFDHMLFAAVNFMHQSFATYWGRAGNSQANVLGFYHLIHCGVSVGTVILCQNNRDYRGGIS